METKVLKIDVQNPEDDILELARKIFLKGGLVVFPTDTVYGLGALVSKQSAIDKIYQVKGRPQEKPLPILVATMEKAKDFTKVSEMAQKLADMFWPGALTLVLFQDSRLVGPAAAGRDTIAVRCPNNRVALRLLNKIGLPLGVTSANLSGSSSSTSPKQVLKELGGKVDLILDGGECPLKAPSTILDLTVVPPKVLRDGPISKKSLKKILKDVE